MVVNVRNVHVFLFHLIKEVGTLLKISIFAIPFQLEDLILREDTFLKCTIVLIPLSILQPRLKTSCQLVNGWKRHGKPC